MSWPFVPIKDCARVISGATPRSTVPTYWDGDLAWVTPKDLANLGAKYIDDTPRKITQAGLQACSAEILPPGSVLFSSRAPIGHVAINTIPMATNQGFKSMVPKPCLDPSFLYWWLRANRERLESLGNGATFKEVSKAVVERIEIPLPPLEEQKRIAAILDQADSLRRLRQRAIDRLNSLGQAIFYEMFGECFQEQRSCDLSDVMTIKKSLVDPKAEPFSSLPHVGPEHIDAGSGRISWGEVRSAAEDGIISGKYEFSAGTVLYSKIRPYLNKVALPDRKGLCSADMYVLEPVDGVADRHFLKFLLMSKDFLSYAGSFSNRANIPKLNRKQLEGYAFLLPSFDKQKGFRERIEGVLEQEISFASASSSSNALFSSLQHRAFRGEL